MSFCSTLKARQCRDHIGTNVATTLAVPLILQVLLSLEWGMLLAGSPTLQCSSDTVGSALWTLYGDPVALAHWV